MKKEISLVTNNLTDIKPYGPDAQPELLLGRGYTGHEHLPRLRRVHLCRVPAHGCEQMFTKSYTHDKNLVASVAYSKDNGYICTEIWITSAALGKARASSALRSLARDLDNLGCTRQSSSELDSALVGTRFG